ncbi:MAG: LysM peptidoglycan-binding domain-containing protein [Oscillospiraceae bacterium]|jgi:LysM repeat protein|nr:LysM peptidoglycan-binding domain-containing protein [Oscillospiraceae bacterium]
MKGSDIMETVNKISDDELDSVSGGTRVPYVVKEGDSLEDLAGKFHCTVEQIMRWNNIADRDQMLIGQKLIIKF